MQTPPKNPRFKLDNSAAIDRADGGMSGRFGQPLRVLLATVIAWTETHRVEVREGA